MEFYFLSMEVLYIGVSGVGDRCFIYFWLFPLLMLGGEMSLGDEKASLVVVESGNRVCVKILEKSAAVKCFWSLGFGNIIFSFEDCNVKHSCCDLFLFSLFVYYLIEGVLFNRSYFAANISIPLGDVIRVCVFNYLRGYLIWFLGRGFY